MSVFTQTFIPNMTSVEYDATTLELAPLLQGFDGWLGFHSAAVVDGGMLISETWKNENLYKTWISTVVSTKVPAAAITAMKTTFVPLHNIVLSKALATV